MNRRELIKKTTMGMCAYPLVSTQLAMNPSSNPYQDILLQRYPGLLSNIEKSVYGSMSEADMRKMSNGMNSVIWNIWHIARVEDIGINCMINEEEQLFHKGKYKEKLNISIDHFGTGMTAEQVRELSDSINITGLREYHQEVQKRSREVFGELGNMKLDEKPDEDYLHKVLIEEGVLQPSAYWVEDVYKTKTKLWFLVHMVLTHSFEHLGQIMLTRKLLGYQGTR